MTAPTVDATESDALTVDLPGEGDWAVPPERDPAPEPDPGAPWGRKADGTPRSKPGRRPKGEPKPDTGKTATPPPRKATSGRKPPPRKPSKPDYRQGIVSLLSLPAGILGAAGAGLGRRELVADAATIMMHAPPIADGLNELAGLDARVAGVLDRVLAAGPYGALVGALVPAFAQIAANHGMIRPGALGTHDPEEIIGAFGGGHAGTDDPAG